jgi:hypothetical protein
MIDLSKLKDKLDADVSFSLNEPFKYVGELKNADKSLERIKLVLTQTIDALNIPPFKEFFIQGSEKTIFIIHHREEIIGAIFPKKVSIEDAKNLVYGKGDLSKKEEVPAVEKDITEEVPVLEDEEIYEKEVLTTEEEKGEIPVEVTSEEREEETDKVITVEKEILAPGIIDKMTGIAQQYLGDFSLDIVTNVIEDSELDKENPSKDQVLEVINSLKNAASLIIGPSKAGDLEKDILNLIQ